MNNLFSISLIQVIQTWRTPLLDRFFILCNWFDTVWFAILLILSVGIFINRKMGYRLALILTLGFLVNKSLKHLFGMPRPLHIDPSLGILSASSPGFPSGAAQSSLLLCGILIKEWSSPLKWLAGPLYMIIISFSRMYLGLHFPGDIIGGWIAGIFLLWIYLSFTNWKQGIIVMASLAIATTSAAIPTQELLYSQRDFQVAIPDKQLAPQSFVIQAGEDDYTGWTENDHAQSYRVMMAAARHFSNDPFLAFGEIHTPSKAPFRWHFVPFKKQTNVFSRYWQQLQVAWRVIFSGGIPLESETKTRQVSSYAGAFDQLGSVSPEDPAEIKGNDPFCNEKIIKNQLVKEGEHVRVLYDYRPVGDSHFLIVPKTHRRDFRQLTEEEYVEAALISRFVINKLRETQPASNLYFLHKTQPDAGQSVLHWHWHVIVADTPQTDFWSKAKFLWRMTFGASPLTNEELNRKVTRYRSILE